MLESSASEMVSEGSIGVAPSVLCEGEIADGVERVGALLEPAVVSTYMDMLAPLEFELPHH